ncbi:iron-siderophore ABC transporter substrate-binding protein [Rhodococcoides kyotonense]|uniref:Iron complex transport system substrate-binding protein n=1 Tax=Rhodococcoides kyotonense TaxID=398843 RepID=A0A239HW77_9NOCA|nr:iron-siderophore ABC transporter substrate-binding protein [Rhodococcus kyotonensis]SNS85589.1 iron complex transport system substrate-binding protein [Rhodococcus kyotonensis]
MPSSFRVNASLALLAVVGLSLTACSSDTGDTAGVQSPASSITEPGAYPATIEHAYGSTVVEEKPARVVTIGWSSQDAALALGTIPVAMERFSGDGIENDVLPWDAEIIGDAPVELLTTNPDVPFEQILGLEPDLILAVYSGISEEAYQRLSDIAPTVAFPESRWETSLTDQTTMIGAALGRPAEAQNLLDGVDDYLADAAASHPEFAGKTVTFGMRTDDGLIVFCPNDPRIELLGQLGIVSSPGVVAACSSGDSSVSVAGEEVDTLDADVLVLVDADGTNLDKAMAFAPFARLTAVSEGRLVRQVGMDYAMAVSAPTVLSIPYAFDTFIGQLEDALA